MRFISARQYFRALTTVLFSVSLSGAVSAAQQGLEKKALEGAQWELHALGITDEATRSRLVTMACRRPVTIAIVGEGGVSESSLSGYIKAQPLPWMPWFNTFEYREGATDPKAGTHDTGQAQVILDLTKLLGVRTRLLVYQPPDDYAVIGETFAKAGQEADLIVCFHSFWGPSVRLIADKTRETSNALFVAPYGETGRPTSESWQAHALKPDGSGIQNFITAIPLARKSPGELLTPSARDERDTETINFVPPSFHASGTGGTCPAAATTAAVAAFVYAASVRKPTPTEVVKLLRETVTVDRAALSSLIEFSDETVNRIPSEIERLTGLHQLQAGGVLSLNNIYRRLAREALPPPTQSPKGVTRTVKPQLRFSGHGFKLENSHLFAELTTQPLALRRLYHKRAAEECLVDGQTSNLFAIAVDDELITSDKFEVVRTKSVSKDEGATVTLALRSPKAMALFSARVDNSCDLRLGLKVTNTDTRPHRLRVFFPLLTHATVGTLKDSYYFYPLKGGWVSNVPFQLEHGYGMPTGSLQMMSLFNPTTGGGVYVRVSDSTGAMKSLWLRKVEEAGVMPTVHKSLREEMRAKEVPFDLSQGISMAFSPLTQVVAPNQTVTLPEAVVGVHEGDWHEALKRYTTWVRTWWRAPNPKVPMWFRRYFNVCALHDSESIKRSRYSGPEQLRPSQQMFQWALWWEHPEVDRLNRPKAGDGYRVAMGDYRCEPRWGGTEAMRQEIKRFHDAGLTAVIYIQSYLVWKHSRIGKEHGSDWVARSPSGAPLEDWTSEETNMDVWDFCVGHPAYQDYLANTSKRLLTETGADGIYLDSMADAYPCYDKSHGHGDDPAKFSLDTLRKVRKVIKATKPQAILQIEDPCSEQNLQFIDGVWLKEFEMYPPMSNYTPNFDAYPIYFLRFYFPEVWFADWGTGDYAPGWRWSFFNGIGTCRWPNEYTARTGRVMQENAEAFASLHPEPMVETEKEGVYANRFPTESKTVHTVYNRNEDAVSGPLLKVSHKRGCHYVELLSGREVSFETKRYGRGQLALLSFEVPAQEVVAVARLPKLLDVQENGKRLTVRLVGQVRRPRLVLLTTDDPDDMGKPVTLRSGRAEIDPAKVELPKGWSRLKLFAGDELADETTVEWP